MLRYLIPALVLLSTSAHAQAFVQGLANAGWGQEWALQQKMQEQIIEQQQLQMQQQQEQLRTLCRQNNILLSQQGYSPAPCN